MMGTDPGVRILYVEYRDRDAFAWRDGRLVEAEAVEDRSAIHKEFVELVRRAAMDRRLADRRVVRTEDSTLIDFPIVTLADPAAPLRATAVVQAAADPRQAADRIVAILQENGLDAAADSVADALAVGRERPVPLFGPTRALASVLVAVLGLLLVAWLWKRFVR